MKIKSCIKIMNEWDIITARQKGRDVAKGIGFTTVEQARIATAISELARNIFLYAGQGQICIEKVDVSGKVGLRIIAADRGPGINNLKQIMGDDLSISGGLGAGLPGVKRLMDEFNIETSSEEGTKIYLIKWLR
ncbi:anti-sigma regulatory factor [Bacillus aquiflavi]|uniref:Anti-sigma regulatory factor n=1 Tax=Bacillus aquiflavi TaxID=2672567 RepID=A0A6B3VVB1_9BACI|nr:anti-sigma regulatory factor [Bacillus aquiflavi]MBA4536831.1 anti-sigma regulatory factor [Bacillus aquiflavi]NEY81198.1 anti-sigma regulatory factor [Bacillus aquiflavi]UAC48490.1 anti-sigma regulatory factor [Bacillus aquiflavi]